jgi:hypothetical protein
MWAGGDEMSQMLIAVLLSLTALGLTGCQGNRLQGSIAVQMIR